MLRSLALGALVSAVLGPVQRIRVPEPRAIIDEAVATLGGLDKLAAADRWIIEGRGRENLSAELQGLSPGGATLRPHEERLGVVRALGRVGWERKTPRNDSSLRWRRFILGADSSGVVDWVGGFGTIRGSPTPAGRRQAMIRRIPHLLAAELAGRSVRLEPEVTRRRLDLVTATLSDGERLTVGFGREPRVLRTAEYTTMMPGAGPTLVRWTWFDWRRHRDLGWAPEGHRIEVGGVLYQEVRYSRYQAESPDSDDLVRIPADPGRFVIREPNPPRFPSVEPPGPVVAPGAHLVDVRGFRVLVVEFADFLLVAEAPEQHPGLEAIPAAGAENIGRTTIELRERLRAVAPTKPRRYLVLSHHHDDHLGGAGALASPGTVVLVAPSHRLAAARALARSPLGGGPSSLATIETVARRRVITDGSRRVEVINVGANPHTDQNLIVWLPAERIVFQGDLFYFEANGPFPPTGRATMNGFFARWLGRAGIDPVAAYGVHNEGAAGAEALAWAARLAPPSGVR